MTAAHRLRICPEGVWYASPVNVSQRARVLRGPRSYHPGMLVLQLSLSIARDSAMKRFLCGLLALGLLVGGTGQAKAQPSYVYTKLDGPASDYTRAHGINDSGQIVGAYVEAAVTHGFLLDNGSYTTLDPPGSISTRAYGINAAGQIVGDYLDAGDTIHGFL